MSSSNYFFVLRIAPTRSLAEITKAYRKVVKEFHPDLHDNSHWANEALKEVNEAYDFLMNIENLDQHYRDVVTGGIESFHEVPNNTETSDVYENAPQFDYFENSLHWSLMNFTEDEIFQSLVGRNIASDLARATAHKAILVRKKYVRANALLYLAAFVGIFVTTSIILFFALQWNESDIKVEGSVWKTVFAFRPVIWLATIGSALAVLRYISLAFTGKNATWPRFWNAIKIQTFVKK